MFELIWMTSALDLLADVYVAATADERERIAAAVEALNARLRSDPLDEGESRSGGRRVTFASVLAVAFRVSVPDRVVRVTSVSRFKR
ncbi:MAG: hypothetical protein K2P78_12605 [Gemmataceae bacterium]|nr:hypothetical protein [Gemmataceae bacterium]